MYRRPAAAAVLLTAALALTACGGSGGGASGTGGTDGTAKAGPPAASAAPDPADTTPAPTTGPDARPTGPVLPDARLTPRTGTFKDNEKKYLSGRVPERMDPAAVLQTGQETCQRIERTAKRDPDAATAAIVSGEVKGAKDAITYLCPEQKHLLAVAEKGFGDGVRTAPAAGTYRALTQSTTCTWQARGKDGAVLASGPQTPPQQGTRITATVPSGTAEFESTGCYAWIPA
ncbi:hypothetical protein [Streptomyces antimicrobicus]|uniref:DUF732 domain-containing protein n=1 Tax=Streptomyces antimicrobicus TaxID=2883108 RepID=A0ABS8AZV6_9ACTN|nr:hypothetical protein [Streptomyces antimicrobicus]MCB5177891.1 hypothetical protein [Streptomyces antimicrobicus]